MRPKKRILLVDGNENRRSVLYYTLTTHSFKVESIGSTTEALLVAAEFSPELVIGCWTPDGNLGRLFDQVKDLCPTATMLIAERLRELPDSVVADVALLGAMAYPAEILQRAKLLCQRKRGPKKMPQSVRATAQQELQTA
jgi:DNA-binding response OmpR family regulator